MHSQSYKRPVGDQYELEVLEIFGEECRVEIYEAIYGMYELDFPLEVAQRLIAFEQRMREKPAVDPYTDYLKDYYSSLEDEYEKEIAALQACDAREAR
jgi:hypothetical protein